LLIQVSLPCALFSPSNCVITYRGGTNVINAPQVDYLTKVFAPMVNKLGVQLDIQISKRGYFPKGGGLVKLSTKPLTSLQPLCLEDRGEINTIEIFSFCSGNLSPDVATRMATAAEKHLKFRLKDYNNIKYIKNDTKEPGTSDEGAGILIVAKSSTGCILGGSAVGEKGKKAEDVGLKAAKALAYNIECGGCIDEYLQDQLIIFMALANGVSRVKIGPPTEHTNTSIYICQQLTGANFSITEAQGTYKQNTHILECTGTAYQNPNLSQ